MSKLPDACPPGCAETEFNWMAPEVPVNAFPFAPGWQLESVLSKKVTDTLPDGGVELEVGEGLYTG